MNLDEKVKQLINAAGALAEMTKIQYDALVRAGFSEANALYLSCEFMKMVLTISTQKDENDE